MRVATIAERVEAVRQRIAAACLRSGRSPQDVTIVAVSKGFPPAAIAEAVTAGIADIGENRVQEAAAKRPHLEGLSPPPTWHMVGHLQTNKVKTALELFDIIHSVDSPHLAQAISQRACLAVRQTRRPVPVLLEVNVAGEASKFGFSAQGLEQAAQAIMGLPNLEVRGLMTLAPLVTDPEEVRPLFRRLRELRDALCLPNGPVGRELSMGMTDDFEVAVEEGATMVRIGRAIFGERPA